MITATSARPPRLHRVGAYVVDVAMFATVGVPLVWFAAGEALRGELAKLLLLKQVSPATLGLDPGAEQVLIRPLLTVLALLAIIVAWLAYRVLAAARWGTSVGKRLFSLEVLDAETLQRGVGTKRALKRCMPSQALALIPVPGFGMLCYLAAFAEPRQRGWHDRAAGTMVVTRQLRA
jgi:uncharacterized RDD family membrane protein YckC